MALRYNFTFTQNTVRVVSSVANDALKDALMLAFAAGNVSFGCLGLVNQWLFAPLATGALVGGGALALFVVQERATSTRQSREVYEQMLAQARLDMLKQEAAIQAVAKPDHKANPNYGRVMTLLEDALRLGFGDSEKLPTAEQSRIAPRTRTQMVELLKQADCVYAIAGVGGGVFVKDTYGTVGMLAQAIRAGEVTIPHPPTHLARRQLAA